MTSDEIQEEIKYQNSLLDAKEAELDLWEKQLDQKAVEIQQLQDKVNFALNLQTKKDILVKSKEKYYELMEHLNKILEFQKDIAKDEITVTFDFVYEIENVINELKMIAK